MSEDSTKHCVVRTCDEPATIKLFHSSSWACEHHAAEASAKGDDPSACKLSGCDLRPVAYGWCGLHADRWKATGQFERTVPPQCVPEPCPVGETFGRLTVLYEAPRAACGDRMWACRCTCDPEKVHVAFAKAIKYGRVVSCGCRLKELHESGDSNRKHGMKDHPLYSMWSQMRGRCLYPDHVAYERYGARGITVDPRWDDFAQFVEDVGERPEGRYHSGYPMYTLDRIDNDGNYEPGNVRWADSRTQANNRRPPGNGNAALLAENARLRRELAAAIDGVFNVETLTEYIATQGERDACDTSHGLSARTETFCD